MWKWRSKSLSWQDLEAVFDAAKLGDEQGIDRLFSFVRSRLMLLARHRVPEAAEDVVQDSLLIVHREFPAVSSLGGLLAFAHQVLRNKIGNVYQGRYRRKQVDLADAQLPYSMDGKSDARELERIVVQSIAKLGENHPVCRSILAALFHGLEPGEISEKLGISKSNLKVRTFRCRRALRDLLRDEYSLDV